MEARVRDQELRITRLQGELQGRTQSNDKYDSQMNQSLARQLDESQKRCNELRLVWLFVVLTLSCRCGS
jgi:hypothetical protein